MLPQFCTVYISAEGMRTHCSILQKDRRRHSDETSRSAQVQQRKTRLEAMKSQRFNFSPELVFFFPFQKASSFETVATWPLYSFFTDISLKRRVAQPVKKNTKVRLVPPDGTSLLLSAAE